MATQQPNFANIEAAVAGMATVRRNAAQVLSDYDNYQQALNTELLRCARFLFVEIEAQKEVMRQQQEATQRQQTAMQEQLEGVPQQLEGVQQQLASVQQQLESVQQRLALLTAQ